jgi:electron transfer flavoprotein beta subunit
MDIVNAKMSINPFCEIAVEEAIRWKEQGMATEVIVASIGPQAVQEQLRSALALGADRAMHIATDNPLEPLAIAKVLHALVKKEQPQVILLGKQSIDGDHNQTGQMLAALCGYPQGTFASRIEFNGEEVWVTRELDGGLQTLALTLPAVITTDLRLNQPRFPTMPNIMKARQKPLAVIPVAEFGLDLQPRLQILATEAPKLRQQGIKVNSVSELVDKLRQEARVL